MPHRLALLLTLATLGLAGPAAADAQDIWAIADQDTPRLTPAAFSQLPEKVRIAVEARRCTIPQSGDNSLPHNVIRGSFGRKGQVDWAVLCSRARASTIFIVWGGNASCPDEMEVREDKSFLERGAGGRIRFSRRIEVVDRAYIVQMHERFGGEDPPPLDHDGIEDRFEGKGSVIRYCSGGRWLELTGAQ